MVETKQGGGNPHHNFIDTEERANTKYTKGQDMPRQRGRTEKKELVLDFGEATPKQQLFLESTTKYTCYGGARGGGKTHVARLKAVGMCIEYPGIKVLMVRAHYPELTANLIDPILRWVPAELYSYNNTEHKMTFFNGSTI